MSARLSRRKFLAATVAAGVASAANVARANDAIRIGLIGAGQRGTRLLHEAMLKQGSTGARVVAVCDAYAPRLAQAALASGAAGYRRWQEVVERPDVDAVIIATPDHWHAPMAMAAMTCGKDVYCEAPMARTAAEAEAVRACAASANRVVQIGAAGASEARFHVARRLIANRAIGEARWSQGRQEATGADRTSAYSAVNPISPHDVDWEAFQGSASKRPFDGRRFVHWRDYWDYSNGIAIETLFDRLTEMLVVIGPQIPRRVSAAGGVYATDGRQTPDSFVATFEYAGGNRIVLASSIATASPLPPVIRGSAGTMYLERSAVILEREESPGSRGGRCARAAFPVADRESHLENWLRCIRSRRPCVCGPELGFAAMAAIEMGLEAYRAGHTASSHGVMDRLAATDGRPARIGPRTSA